MSTDCPGSVVLINLSILNVTGIFGHLAMEMGIRHPEIQTNVVLTLVLQRCVWMWFFCVCVKVQISLGISSAFKNRIYLKAPFIVDSDSFRVIFTLSFIYRQKLWEDASPCQIFLTVTTQRYYFIFTLTFSQTVIL